MPLENPIRDENLSEQAPENNYKLTIILLILILIAGSYLAYSIYNSNKSNDAISTENTSSNIADTTTINSDKPSSEIANTSSDNPIGDKVYSISQVAEKNSKSACWTIIDGGVYDITSYIPNHPGGEDEIVKVCGKDGSQLFAKPMEHKEGGARNVLSGFKIGNLGN